MIIERVALDPNFNAGAGPLTFAGTTPLDDRGSDVAIDSAGRILIIGMTVNSGTSRDVALWRFDRDGALDPGFGNNGYRSLHRSPYDWGQRVIPLPSGAFVACGNMDYGQDDPTIWRFDAQGALDPSFGVNGSNRAIMSGEVQGIGCTRDPAGRYILLGSQYDNWFGIARFSDEGLVDSSFGVNGQLRYSALPKSYGSQVLATAESQLLVLGNARPRGSTSDRDMLLWRVGSDGTLDATFGTGGYLAHDGAAGSAGSDDVGTGMAMDAQGAVYVVGQTQGTATQDLAIWKVTPTGELDRSFGEQGLQTHHNAAGGEGNDAGNAALLDANGRLVVAGSSEGIGGEAELTLWRFSADGQLDPGFNGSGHFSVGGSGLPADRSVATALVIDSAGRLIVTGAHGDGATRAMALWIFRLTPFGDG